MRKTVLLILLPVFLLGASDTTKPFYWLKELVVMEHTYRGVAKILYNPNISTVIKKKIPGDPEPDFILAMETRLNSSSDKVFQVFFSNGFSADPTFLISEDKFTQYHRGLFTAGGLVLVIPGNGSIYVSGHANTYFDERRKFTYSDSNFVEIKQPYKYVGLKTTVKQEMNIYSDKSMMNVVAKLTKGTKIEVLVNEGDYYLIKTGFGLVGWHKHERMEQVSPFIDGLYFNGD